MYKALFIILMCLSIKLQAFEEYAQESFMDLCLRKDSLPEAQRDFIEFLMSSNHCGSSLRQLEKIPMLYFKETYVEWSLLREAKSLHTLHLNSYEFESLDFLRGMRKLKNITFERIRFSPSVDLMVFKQLPMLKSITIVASNLSARQRLFLSRLPGIELRFVKKSQVFPS